MNTKPASILLPDAPMVVRPVGEWMALLQAGGRPFKITGAERVGGIDYSKFACPGFFFGLYSCCASDYGTNPWPLEMMFSGFTWPSGARSPDGSVRAYIGEVDFLFRVVNRSDKPQPFQIKLLGLELT